ncbi:MAG: site-specific integrase [Meiothermus sp.]|uniref:tyrosine-type recombinase/integrase n=1 Tax=Meiothermus sp. TaxID=1955249 RepID=UPI0021DC8C7A|nr:site-specific integrase [Meiothermus sp.]GIW28195.1 MAG: site-specific integrase [Meiothermus sp.]
MAKKRGKGGGTTYLHKASGRWCAELNLGYDGDGKPLRVRSYHPTRKEAEAWLAEQVALYHKGLLADPSTVTLQEWAERWLERKRREVRPRTFESYRYELGLVLPTLGKLPLQKITPSHIRALVDNLLQTRKPRTARAVRTRLHAIFEEALNLEVIHRNPVSPVKVKLPRGSTTDRAGRSLEAHEAAALLTALDTYKDERIALSLRLMLNLGLRVGECLGLQWQDLDLEAGTLTIRRAWSDGRLTEPKTPSSRRTLPVPHSTLERLRAYHAMWEDRLGETPPATLWLFPGNDPTRPLDYRAPAHALRRIVKALGIPPLRVHDLRHSYGSHLLANGAPLELVSERMGHANANITLSIYRHVLEHERQGWVVDVETLLSRPRAKA